MSTPSTTATVIATSSKLVGPTSLGLTFVKVPGGTATATGPVSACAKAVKTRQAKAATPEDAAVIQAFNSIAIEPADSGQEAFDPGEPVEVSIPALAGQKVNVKSLRVEFDPNGTATVGRNIANVLLSQHTGTIAGEEPAAETVEVAPTAPTAEQTEPVTAVDPPAVMEPGTEAQPEQSSPARPTTDDTASVTQETPETPETPATTEPPAVTVEPGPAGLIAFFGPRVAKALVDAGHTDIESVRALSDEELSGISGFGAGSIAKLRGTGEGAQSDG